MGGRGSKEEGILAALDAALRQPGVTEIIDAAVERVEAKLRADSQALLAWEPVPLEVHGGRLPAAIRSSWVFVLRAGTTSGAERHPNSHQRVMSYRGAADLQTWSGERWESNRLTSDPAAPLERRWLSIPVTVWHKPVMGPLDWAVVSFHTALERELIEERGDPAEREATRRRTYL